MTAFENELAKALKFYFANRKEEIFLSELECIELAQQISPELKSFIKEEKEIPSVKLYLCRTPVSSNVPIDDQNFLEAHPDKEYLYTKLYICYEKPDDIWCETARKVEIKNYMYPEIQPGQMKVLKG